MVERALYSGEEKSKYYIHNEGLIQELESFTNKLSGEITGEVNGCIIDYKLVFNHKNYKYCIKGLRQHSNTVAFNSNKYTVTKNTIIEIGYLPYIDKSWVIYKRNLMQDFYLKLTRKWCDLEYQDGYALYSKYEINDTDVLKNSILHKLLKIAELRSIKREGDKLSIEYFNFLGVKSIQNVMQAVNMIA